MRGLAILGLSLPLCAAAPQKPNIVFILADDLNNDYNQDRLAIMPNLSRLRDMGSHFTNHAAVQPVCGPSRSSFLQGRYPHSTGYVCNSDKASQAAYLPLANDTVGTWLTAAGYHTAFEGKYLNNLEKDVASGWNHWGAFSSSEGTYNYKNSTPYNVTFDRSGLRPTSPIVWHAMEGVHQADFLGQRGVEQMQAAAAAGLPYFVHLTPLMVHAGQCVGPLPNDLDHALDDPWWEKNLTAWGCAGTAARPCAFTASPCPTDRHKHASDALANPHVPSWNATASGGTLPTAMLLPPVSPWVSQRMDIAFRNRSSALLDLDYLIGVVLDAALALDPGLSNTYFFFSSDNGFHLGERRMPFGKEHPYQTDVSLPFYAAGPGVPRGAALAYPTTHIDLTATIVELAGATASRELEGLSFASAFRPSPPTPEAWRPWQFAEHHCGQLTWRSLRWPLRNVTYSMWCGDRRPGDANGAEEVFDHGLDPWELSNIAEDGGPGKAVAAESGPLAEALWACSGKQCHAPIATPVRCLCARARASLGANVAPPRVLLPHFFYPLLPLLL